MPFLYIVGRKKYNTMEKSKEQSSFPIDFVYLWVDGNDPAWREKKERYSGAGKEKGATAEARFRDNDELKYSLRSVEKFAPWVNRIFIVTDKQIPSWLKTEGKVCIIDHSQIFPADALPTFNSQAIESVLHRIPGLSEHFILGNDDTMLAAPVTPDDFFTQDGTPIVRLYGTALNRKKALRSTLYKRTVLKMQELIQEKYGTLIKYPPHHNFDAYRKSYVMECREIFKERWDATAYSRFRSENDIQQSIVGYYMIATGKGIMRKVGRFNRINGACNRLKAIITGRYANDSRTFPISTADYCAVMRKYNPLMFCINDDENSTTEDFARMEKFLNTMFPEKSSFEK